MALHKEWADKIAVRRRMNAYIGCDTTEEEVASE